MILTVLNFNLNGACTKKEEKRKEKRKPGGFSSVAVNVHGIHNSSAAVVLCRNVTLCLISREVLHRAVTKLLLGTLAFPLP
uniref:Uncharacterized protein n=1 Tax=Anguilla anguilla TaxID=7936 RepID=A0A0E9W2P5_ANGAN